ncbi:Ltp family lipoprotein [Microbacterium sp. G2-8]|uniref:Ltp family lipoprotein n=1 Tax=Microbacterium sp. G2-8 TaxID=2842454 RepID=UPI001C8949D8|nr:Ltp family lipoprotein [Microbacterium sp. G2-8]
MTNSPGMTPGPQVADETKPKKPWFTRWWVWVIAAAVVVGGIGSALGLGDDDEDLSASEPSETTAPEPAATPSEDPVEDVTEEPAAEEEPAEPVEEEPAEPEMSLSQENAVGDAQSYLAYSGFSHESLVTQLEFEGYPREDAEFAIEYLAPDWNAEAVESAESYLDYSSFSRQELLDQLLHEGFTPEQAEHGLAAVGY